MEDLSGKKEVTTETTKCSKCGEIKSFKDFSKHKANKNNLQSWCRKCSSTGVTQYRNTEIGYLRMRYGSMRASEFRNRVHGRKNKCLLTFDEFLAAWKRHKSIYGMKSAWGPGINNLEQHLPVTMVHKVGGQGGKLKGSKQTGSNLSVDRLDPNQDYTLQNIIFIRADENDRKKHTTYSDCLIQIKLHDERFKNDSTTGRLLVDE
tara:strand:+ start:31 stop:645 length:615 start_codon:yes stop_codon:yes gene_type:complete